MQNQTSIKDIPMYILKIVLIIFKKYLTHMN